MKTNIKVLFEELVKLGVWVRPHYMYPYASVDEIVPLMAEGKILPYLDVPFQHAHPRILKAMKRPGSEYNMERINAWRAICPDITIRSTFITGFPGETEYDFNVLKDFVNEQYIDRLGIFTYSEEEGTPAAKFTQKVPEEVKQQRKDALMALQQEVSKKINKGFVGQKMTVIIDGYLPEDDVYVARSYRDAPNVDGNVFITLNENDSRELMSGTFLDVVITDSSEYDLIAKTVQD